MVTVAALTMTCAGSGNEPTSKPLAIAKVGVRKVANKKIE
jgi:hypothetical protein